MLAAVDVGSNTVRMLLATVNSGQITPVVSYRRITRLAGRVENNELNRSSVELTLQAIDEISRLFREHRPVAVRVVGTEALRSAANGQAVADEISRRCGYPLEVLNGTDEALLSTAGVLAALVPKPEQVLIFDIGGGSTEFVLYASGVVLFSHSYPVGVVRLTEAGPRSRMMRMEMLTTLLAQLEAAGVRDFVMKKGCQLVGTAGTVTTLAATLQRMETYDWRLINNYRMTKGVLKSLLDTLEGLTPEEREELPGIEQGRGDLILPGAQLVTEIMQVFQKQSLLVSDFGLMEGALLSLDRP